MHEEEKVRWLRIHSQLPLLSVRNVSDMTCMDADAVRRRYRALSGAGLLTSLQMGMTEPRQTRILATRAGVELAYETRHIHPTSADLARIRRLEPRGEKRQVIEEFWRGCDRTHTHDPFGVDNEDHVHPPWTTSRSAGWTLTQRLPRTEAIYSVAPTLLRSGALGAEMPVVAQRGILDMTDLWWLRQGRLYDAVAQYGDDVMVAFTYVGPEVTETQLREKLQRALQDLISMYQRPGRRRRIWDRNDPDGPPPPTLSAHVVIAADAFAMDVAKRVCPTAAILCADGRSAGTWTYRQSFHVIRDRGQGLPKLGRPERLAEQLDGRESLTAVLDMPSYNTFLTIAKFPGMRPADIGVVVGVANAKKFACLADLERRGLVFRWRERCYLDRPGMILLARLNRVSPSSIIHRFERYLDAAFRERERRHDDGVNALVVSFARMGVAVEPGWRRVIDLSGRTQIRPDAWVEVERGPLGTGWYGIEVELSAKSPSRVSQKSRPYRVAAELDLPLPLAVVCADDRAEINFLERGAGIPMITCTVDRAKAGPLVGRETVWRHDGTVVALHCPRKPRRGGGKF